MEVHPPAHLRKYPLVWGKYKVQVWKDEAKTDLLKEWSDEAGKRQCGAGCIVSSSVGHLEMMVHTLVEEWWGEAYWYEYELIQDNVPAPHYLTMS